MAKKKITSSQVAEKAGVSQATVSMILNRRSNVSFSAETVEKVECAARELGYELPKRRNRKENENNQIGRELEILIENITPDKKYYIGRSYMDVPGIDGIAYVENNVSENLIGKYIKAKVISVKEYDIFCSLDI